MNGTALHGYGSAGAKPVVAVKGSTGGGASTGSLPFTGFDIGTLIILSALLLLSGWGLRRSARRK